MTNNEPSLPTRMDRRELLKVAGGASIVGFAGCAGDGDGGGDGSDGNGGGDGEPMDSSLTYAGGSSKVQFNPYGTNYVQDPWVLFEPLGRYDWRRDKFQPLLIKEWSVGDSRSTVTLTIDERFQWTDGNDILAEDLLTKFKLDKAIGTAVWDFAESVQKSDDRAVEFSLGGETNTDLFLFTVLHDTSLDTPNEIYGEYRESIEDASTEQEQNSVLEELLDFALDEPVSNGPFKWEERAGSEYRYSKFEDYPEVDQLNFPQMNFKGGNTGQAQDEVLIGDEVDGTYGGVFNSDVVSAFPDHMNAYFGKAAAGIGIAFNFEREPFDDWRVRKALAYATDLIPAAQNANLGPFDEVQNMIPPSEENFVNTGMTPENNEQYLGDSLSDYETGYTQSQNTDKAAELLQSAGYEKQSGSWVDESGSPLTVPVTTATQAQDLVAAGETVIEHWQEFGLNAEHQTVEGTSFWGGSWENGEWQVATMTWGSTKQHPYFSFTTQFTQSTDSKAMNYPYESIEAPPVGEIEDWDNAQTYEPNQIVRTLASSTAGSDTEQTAIQKLGWIWNQTVPWIPFAIKQAVTVLSDDHWNVPEDTMTEQKFPAPYIIRPPIPEIPHITAKTQ